MTDGPHTPAPLDVDDDGGWYEIAEVAMFDHARSRTLARHGVPFEQRQTEILAEHLITRPLPRPQHDASLGPMAVHRWLHDGDSIDLGGRDLRVIHSPGEAPDHVCLLDRVGRLLFSGDILLAGPVWTHLDGGDLPALVASYRTLLDHADSFDLIMPSHNSSALDGALLPASLRAAEQILAGTKEHTIVTDPWQRRLREYRFEGFQILTRL